MNTATFESRMNGHLHKLDHGQRKYIPSIVIVCFGILNVAMLPVLHMPPVTPFIDGSGPVVPGKLFPFCFITIACGAISGFHALISSGTTPKLIDKETHARPIGYGAMLCESIVGVMALIAASSMFPHDYFQINVPVEAFAKRLSDDIANKV